MSATPENLDAATQYPEATIEAVVRLLAKVASIKGSLPAKKRVLVNGLGTILDADGWLWSATRVLPDQDTPISVGVLYDGLTEDEFSGWVEASQVGKPGPPEDPPLTALFSQGKHFTQTRQQLVPDDVWYTHPTVKKYRLDRGIDHFVYTVYPLGEATCSAIGFFRRVGRDPFDELERRVCHLVTANVEWMHFATFPEHQGAEVPDLTPRQRTVLVYLLSGKTKGEIASLLGLSGPTVGEHISRIYKHFGVASQVALMGHFQAGDAVELGGAGD